MVLDDLVKSPGQWISGGPESDVVISSRARLALAGRSHGQANGVLALPCPFDALHQGKEQPREDKSCNANRQCPDRLGNKLPGPIAGVPGQRQVARHALSIHAQIGVRPDPIPTTPGPPIGKEPHSQQAPQGRNAMHGYG